MIYGHQINQDVIVVTTDQNVYNISEGNHPNYNAIKEALLTCDYDKAEGLLDLESTVREFGDGKLIVENGAVSYKGRHVVGVLENYILRMIEEGASVDPMIAFLDNLYLNPSKRSVEQLFRFLEANMMPLTPDGCFLAYKFVRADGTDWHSGTICNLPGETVSMDRNEVDDDPDRTCSSGLHVCSLPYLKSMVLGNSTLRIMVVKVNPRDVVSVPTDYKDTKMRCCLYTVLSEIDRSKFDLDDEKFEGAFDHIVEDGDYFNYYDDDDEGLDWGTPSQQTTVPDSELSKYKLGLKHGTIAHNRQSDFAPSKTAMRDSKGHYVSGHAEYLSGYKDGFSGTMNFFECFEKDRPVDDSDDSFPSDSEILNATNLHETNLHATDLPCLHRYALGLKHGKLAAQRDQSYSSGMSAAYLHDEGYQEGYDDGYYDHVDFQNIWKDV